MNQESHKLFLQLHHVGVVVPTLDEGRSWYTQQGYKIATPVYIDPIQKVMVQFLRLASNVLLELVEPNGDDSPVSNFLAKRGPGLHHLCHEVNNIDDACTYARKHGGVITCEPVSAVAFQGRKIAFVYWNCGLVEFLEHEK